MEIINVTEMKGKKRGFLFVCLKKNLKIHPVTSAEAQRQQQYHTTGVTARTRLEKVELQTKGGGAQRIGEEEKEGGTW